MTETVTVPRGEPLGYLHKFTDMTGHRCRLVDSSAEPYGEDGTIEALVLASERDALEAALATTRADLARERERAEKAEARARAPDGRLWRDVWIAEGARRDEVQADRDALAAALADARERAAGSMDVLAAMRETMALARQGHPIRVGSDALAPLHLRDMLTRMEAGAFSYGKQCRWLGWAQAAVVANGDATLDDMKAINKRCQRSRQEPAR